MTTFDKSGRMTSCFIPPPKSTYEREVDAFFEECMRHFPDNKYVGRTMTTSAEVLREHLHSAAIILGRNTRPGPVRDEGWHHIRAAWTHLREHMQ